jgi:hypothetical protein
VAVKGGWCVGLTKLTLSCADCLEIKEPQIHVTLSSHQTCTGIALPLPLSCKLILLQVGIRNLGFRDLLVENILDHLKNNGLHKLIKKVKISEIDKKICYTCNNAADGTINVSVFVNNEK